MNPGHKAQIDLINQQMKELVGIYRDAVKGLDISESEFWTWYTLITIEGPHTQQDICSMWSLPKQTVNTVITRMRLKRYAYLESVPGTRNHKIVRLTEEGRKYGETLILPISRAEEKVLSKVSSEEISLVTNLFGKYIDMIRSEFHENE